MVLLCVYVVIVRRLCIFFLSVHNQTQKKLIYELTVCIFVYSPNFCGSNDVDDTIQPCFLYGRGWKCMFVSLQRVVVQTALTD